MITETEREVIFDIECPVCGSKKYIGFLGGKRCRRYFCSECCIEFTVKIKTVKIIMIDDKEYS